MTITITKDEVDRLPAAQYLLLETLIARYREGHLRWTFPRRFKPQLNALQKLGLISWQAASVYGFVNAWINDTAHDLLLEPGYKPPAERKTESDATVKQPPAWDPPRPAILPGALAVLPLPIGAHTFAKALRLFATEWKSTHPGQDLMMSHVETRMTQFGMACVIWDQPQDNA